MAKKKIKDLTLEECDKICDKQGRCKNCPIRSEDYCYRSWLVYFKDFKEREVEVDE